MSKKEILKTCIEETDKNIQEIKDNGIRLLNCSTGNWMVVKQNHQNPFQTMIEFYTQPNYHSTIKPE